MTKMHEAQYRGHVSKLYSDLQEIHEGNKIKGEVTIVIAPAVGEDETLFERQAGSGFDPLRDAEIKCNILTVARNLNK